MPAGDGLALRVDPQAVGCHADLVLEAAGGVEQARQAGDGMLVGADAYGILCSFLPRLLEPAQRQTVDTLAAVATGFRAMAQTVREGAASYVQLDEQIAASYRRIGAR